MPIQIGDTVTLATGGTGTVKEVLTKYLVETDGMASWCREYEFLEQAVAEVIEAAEVVADTTQFSSGV